MKQRNTIKTTEEVQKELSDKFNNLLVMEEYTGANDKILVKCTDCDYEWKAIIRSVIKSACGCPKCGVSKKAWNKAKENFIDKLDSKFELIEYISPKKAVVKCKDCGYIRDTTPNNIHRFSCKRCSSIRSNSDRKLNNEIFIERARKIHGDKYNYDNTEYTTYNSSVKISCPIHGEFEQRAGKHLMGQNCPKCRESSGEGIIRNLLEKNNISYIQEKRIKLYKSIRVDFL